MWDPDERPVYGEAEGAANAATLLNGRTGVVVGLEADDEGGHFVVRTAAGDFHGELWGGGKGSNRLTHRLLLSHSSPVERQARSADDCAGVGLQVGRRRCERAEAVWGGSDGGGGGGGVAAWMTLILRSIHSIE